MKLESSNVPPAAHGSILLVDDDRALRRIIGDRLRSVGYDVEVACSGEEALRLLESFEPALMLLDLRMPNMDGFGVLERLSTHARRPEVVVITAHGSIESAVRAVQLGAADFVPKPFEPAHLEHVVARVLSARRLKSQVEILQTELSARHTFVSGQSAAMLQASKLAQKAAKSSASILLLGESGSGKEVLARLIHAQSPRAEGPFVAVNCATLSAEMLHSELFGHERGAFTGATQNKVGRLEQAQGGTLFLDEIGEFAVDLQAKLLRAIQEREFERLGGTRTIKADVRILAATHRDLRQAIREGSFREDLYYRLNVVSIAVPPLRERQEDLPALLAHFLQRFANEAGRPGLSLSDRAKSRLLAYPWPGNVREVSNVMERAVVLADGASVELEDLPDEIAVQPRRQNTLLSQDEVPLEDAAMGFHEAVAEAKRRILSQALERCNGHQTRASALLGLTQPYMSRLLKTLGVVVEKPRS